MEQNNFKIELDDDKKDVFLYEDKEYLINETGDLLNEDSSIFKTKDEVEEYKKSLSINNDDETEDENVIDIDGASYKLDSDGNALNEDGSIFKKKDELENPDTEDSFEKVLVDGKEYKLDKDGNAIDDKGEIVYKSEDLEIEEDNKGVLDISKLQENTKIVIKDESGKPVIYENTEEGVAQYIQDVKLQTQDEYRNEALNDLLGQYSQLSNVINYLKINKGSLEGFNARNDYSKITLDKDNSDQLKGIILEARKNKGDSETSAKQFVEFAEDKGTLFDVAKEELKWLNSKQESENKELQNRVDEENRLREEQQNKYWGIKVDDNGKIIEVGEQNSIYNKLVKTGELSVNGKQYTIPEKVSLNIGGKVKIYNREDIFNYAYVPQPVTINGKTEYLTGYEIDKYKKDMSRTADDDILEIYNSFTGNDLGQLIEKNLKRAEVKKIKKLIVKNKSRSGNNNQQSSRNKSEKEELEFPV